MTDQIPQKAFSFKGKWPFIAVLLFLAANLFLSYYSIKYTPITRTGDSYFYLFVSGVLYFISIVTFIQFLFFKESTYSYYALYILVNLCYFTFMYSSHTGENTSFPFWFDWLRYSLAIPLLTVSYLLYVLFAISFLNLRSADEFTYKWLSRFSAVYFVLLIVSLLLILLPPNYPLADMLRTIILVSCMPMGIASILLVYFRIKNNISRILCIGSLCFFAGSVFGFLFSSNILAYPSETPPFNQWVFYTEIGTLLELILFSSSFAYRNKILADEEKKAKEMVLQEAEKNKQKEQKLQMIRDEIARDLHDDIGASLSNINILNELARRNALNPEKAEEYLSKAGEDIQSISESLSDIVWNINPRYDNPENLFIRMRRYAADMMDGKNINYEINFPASGDVIQMSMEQRRDFYLIFKEAVNNLVKYSEASHAVINIEQRPDSIYMSVKDNGKGFDANIVKEGNGLTNMQKRALDMKGELIISATPGKGTEVILIAAIT